MDWCPILRSDSLLYTNYCVEPKNSCSNGYSRLRTLDLHSYYFPYSGTWWNGFVFTRLFIKDPQGKYLFSSVWKLSLRRYMKSSATPRGFEIIRGKTKSVYVFVQALKNYKKRKKKLSESLFPAITPEDSCVWHRRHIIFWRILPWLDTQKSGKSTLLN